MLTLVLSLDELAGSGVSLVGGKAASLGRIYKSGIKVPDTICVTTQAYQIFLAETGIREKILIEIERKAFSDMRWEELWDSALRLRNLHVWSPPIASAGVYHAVEFSETGLSQARHSFSDALSLILSESTASRILSAFSGQITCNN